MAQTIDYNALGIMMAMQARLMAKAIKQLNDVVDSRKAAPFKLVQCVEILRKLDRDLEEVS